MSKIHLILALALFFVVNRYQAQTITAADCDPQLGEVYKDYGGPYVSPGSAGTGQLWSFNTPVTNSFTNSTMQLPNAAYSQTFSMANMQASIITSLSGVYYRIANNRQERVGATNSYFDVYTDPALLVKFPIYYGAQAIIDTFAYKRVLTYYYTPFYGTTTITVDGTGTLTTSQNTFTNAIRVKSKSTYTNADPTFSTAYSEETYRWYVPNVHLSVLSVRSLTTITQISVVTGSITYRSNPLAYVSVEQQNQGENKLSIFPNPVSEGNEITIRLSMFLEEPRKLSVYAADGRRVYYLESEDEVIKLNSSIFNSGLYFLKVESSSGALIGTNKILITQ